MTFSRLLPLLLLVPALTMADEDRNFKLTSENFKVGSLLEGSLLENASKKAIALDKSLAISQEPVFPLQPNTLYLRYKKSAKEYLWFSGEAKPEEYKKLHAFSLKGNHLTAREVLGLRLYASRQYKAFQDEADIYFDAEYVYSPRVAKLLFMKNGKWQVLNESAHPGMVQIKSDEKNLDVVSLNSKIKAGTRTIYPAENGVYIFSFSAPDKLPYVDAAVLKPGEVLTFNVKFPVQDTVVENPSSSEAIPEPVVSSSSAGVVIPDFDVGVSSSSEDPSSSASSESKVTVSPKLTVTLDQVQALQVLEDAESLYDIFSVEVDKNFRRIDTTEFSKFYPSIIPAESLGLNDSGKAYRSYVKHYNLKRSEAQKIWRERKLGEVSAIYKAFHVKFDSLQALPIEINMLPVAVEKIVKAVDTTAVTDTSVKALETGKVDSLNLHFGTDRNRVEVSWKGVVDGFSMDSLVNLLANGDSSLVTTLFLVNNSTVSFGSITYDFENSTMQGWTYIDADGDGRVWEVLSNAAAYNLGLHGTGFGNASSTTDCVTTGRSSIFGSNNNYNNYLVSPKVQLGGSISFYVRNGNANNPEHFGVAVSTTNNTSASAFTTIQEWYLISTHYAFFQLRTESIFSFLSGFSHDHCCKIDQTV